MENLTNPRPGCPRKTVPDAEHAEENPVSTGSDDDLGHASESETVAPAEPAGQSEGVGWLQLASVIRAKHSPAHQIATVWHPAPAGELLNTEHGNVRVLEGSAKYQLTTGEVIEV